MRDYAKLIGHLIAKAESAQEMGNVEEATAYRAKAEHLMGEYRISEEETIAGDAFSIVPIKREVVIMETGAYLNAMKQDYMALFREIARHAGVRVNFEYRWSDSRSYEESSMVAVTYGYDMDIRLAEFYWTAARLVFMTRIDARVNPELSDQENCYFLRNSGMPRNEIATKLWGSGPKDGAAHGKVQKLYLAECAKRNEQPLVSGRGIQVKLYREAYANAFVSEFGWRLRDARLAAETGGGLELPGRKERVNEAFYADHPEQRPMTAEQIAKLREERAAYVCEPCENTKSPTGKCRRHRPRTATQADYRRWDRESNGPEARAGRVAGSAAAKAVNVSRTAGTRTAKAEPAPTRREIG